jgi:hypothetical protein
MTALLLAGLKRFGGWILAALSIAGALFVALRSSRIVGKAEANVEAAKEETKRNEEIAVREIDVAREAAKTEVETVKGANDVQANISRLDAGDAANKLRDKWARD